MTFNFFEVVLCVSAAFAIIYGVCRPGLVSVIFMYCVKMCKYIIGLFHHLVLTILVFPYEWRYSDGGPS